MISEKDMRPRKFLYVTKRDDWRAWLQKHQARETEIWLVYYKKHTGRIRIPYEDAVEEALCFGWIDSIVKRIDDERFAQKFTPRRNTAKWSALNKRRVRKLIKEGRMTESGLAKIDLQTSYEEPPTGPRKRKLQTPAFMKEAMTAHPRAWENFTNLAPSYRRNYIGWILAAKKEETRARRLKEVVELLKQNKKLGLK